MRTVFFVILITLCFTVAVFGNSIFSFDGMPIQNYGSDVYAYGMGDAGSGDLFRVNTNYTNPAMAASANKVIFSTAVTAGFVWYADDNGNGFRDDALDLPYFTFSFPMKKHRFGFAFNSFSSGNLENSAQSSDDAPYDFEEINRVSSGLFKADLLYAFKNKFLNVGVSTNYYFGHHIQYFKQDYDDSGMTDTKYEIEKKFKKPGFTVGVSKKIGKVSFGTSYSSYTKLDGDKYYKYVFSPYIDTLGITDYEIPARVSGGLTVKISERFKLSADVNYELYESTDSFEFNTYKAALGLAYDPLSGYGKWFERIPLRCGGYYRELPFKLEGNNEKITEIAGTFGFSIPLKSKGKKLDFGIKLLQRGDVDVHGVQDKSAMFTIGITGFDIFGKRKKKTEHRDIPEADEVGTY
jgi:hypothetical protein